MKARRILRKRNLHIFLLVTALSSILILTIILKQQSVNNTEKDSTNPVSLSEGIDPEEKIDLDQVRNKSVDSAADVVSSQEQGAKPRPTSSNSKNDEEENVPVFGEDPDNEGRYVVFDKDSVMELAGVPKGDYDYVKGIHSNSTWVYRSDSSEKCIFDVNPCIKMKAAGEDYATNPVTQVKWLSNYAKSRYDGWKSAYKFYINNGFF